MVQIWISLIKSLNSSLFNILFFCLICLLSLIIILWSEFSRSKGNLKFKDLLKSIWAEFSSQDQLELPNNSNQTEIFDPLEEVYKSIKEENLNNNSLGESNSDFLPIFENQEFPSQESSFFPIKQIREKNQSNLPVIENPSLADFSDDEKDNGIKVNIFKGLQNDQLNNNRGEKNFDGFIALNSSELLAELPSENAEPFRPVNQSIYFPLIELKGTPILRFKELNILKRAFEERDLNFLIGDLSIGKSYLSSLFAREMRFNEGYSVISFSFNQNISSLKEGLKLILLEQLKLAPLTVKENTLQIFLKTIVYQPFFIILENIELLSSQDLAILYNLNLGASKLLLISSSLSARSICQTQPALKKNIIQISELESDSIQNYFLEKIPLANKLSPLAISKLQRFIKGNPLALKLLCHTIKTQAKQNPDLNLEDFLKSLENLRVSSDRRIPLNLYKVLALGFKLLNNVEKEILLFAAYLPTESFSNGLIEFVFELSSNQAIQILDNLNQSGLILRFSLEPFQEPCFKVHALVRDFIFTEFKIDTEHFKHLSQKLIYFFANLLQDKDKLNRENALFLIPSLTYAIRLINNENFQETHLMVFLEKVTAYFDSMGFEQRLQSKILPLYEENLQSANGLGKRAFWQRLIGLSNIMLAHQKLTEAEKLKSIQQGIDLLTQALNNYSSNFAQTACIQINYDLGKAYFQLAEAELNDRENNLIKAVEHFKKSIQMQSNKYALEYILVHVSLGNTYLKLYDTSPNVLTLHLAIQILMKVIKSFSESLSLDLKSSIHHNIGNAFRSLALHEDAFNNLQNAAGEYKQALNGVSDLQEKSLIYNSLGCCFWSLAKYTNTIHHLETAITAYKRSLTFIVSQADPLNKNNNYTPDSTEYAVTLNNLGTSYKALAQFKEHSTNIVLASKAFKEALRITEKRADLELKKVITKHLIELSQSASPKKLIENKNQH
jgi:hypothetical protein